MTSSGNALSNCRNGRVIRAPAISVSTRRRPIAPAAPIHAARRACSGQAPARQRDHQRIVAGQQQIQEQDLHDDPKGGSGGGPVHD